jgi:hypothetical protein
LKSQPSYAVPDQPLTSGPFTSTRERRLWFCVLLVLLAIWATLPLAGTLTELLARYRHLVDDAYVLAFFTTLAAMAALALSRRPGLREIWALLGIAIVFGMLFLRIGVPERTHLFEYGLVAVLAHEALLERSKHRPEALLPAATAIALTALLGLFDEVLQSALPERVFDPIDIAFNAIAGTMMVTASVVLRWARDLDLRRRG